MNLYQATKTSHYYTPAGEPAYDADLRRARKEGLLPSVTTIQKAAAKPALVNWQLTQAVLAALTLPRKPDEPLEEFAERVVADSGKEASAAAEWGTRMHRCIELALMGKRWAEDAALYGLGPWMDSFTTWMDQHVALVLDTEKVVVSTNEGYAGKLDARIELKDGRLAVTDFKGRNVRGGKVAWYREQCQQLAAYKHAGGYGHNTELMSVVIDRNTPTIHTKIWSGPEAEQGLKSFLALNQYWRHDNNFYP